ncbi:MAG TPA: putative baseplate assembly protein [Candidatus Binatia bacterium]|nr:putative baseplate assembly protein [Candidatus Binatia bacterium]
MSAPDDIQINPAAASGDAVNDCGCCEGVSKETPSAIANRPGLSAVAYRVGRHGQFKETMLARLSGSNYAALSALTTRDNDDFSIALLDAWATVADVLTFYQERIANEVYLRTATERFSVRELARLINYQLNSGVAASVYLAFSVESAPGALGEGLNPATGAQPSTQRLPSIPIDTGTKVQSVPGPGELAQTFETVEPIAARAEWNAMKPRLTRPQQISATAGFAIFQGTATNLKEGDALLIVDDTNEPALTRIIKLRIDDESKTTRADFTVAPSLPPFEKPKPPPGRFDRFFGYVPLTNQVIREIASEKWSVGDLAALAKIQRWSTSDLFTNLAKPPPPSEESAPLTTGIFALRQRAALFGYNAPKQPTYNGTVPKPPSEWDEWDLDTNEAANRIFLDAAYQAVSPKSYVAVDKPGKKPKIFQLDNTTVLPRTAYGISSKTTLLVLPTNQSWHDLLPARPDLGDLRDVVVHAQSEALALADLPIEDLIPETDGTITLDGIYNELETGQTVVVTGRWADLGSSVNSEVRKLEKVDIEARFTVLTFDQPLKQSYVRSTVTINANVALATHGETVQEVLGGGDATQPFPRFSLKQPPLTYVPAANPTGAQSTLEVRVNDLLWHEVPSFYDHDPEERIYITRTDDDGKTTVIFGDGATAARVPTGQENVRAKYRKGIGLGGLVKADRLTQLMTRPLGVKGVTNPSDATGAADPEVFEDARRNAPRTILTFGRIVSLKDYEDFARGFSGIAKALATPLWFGEKRGVFITVAGSAGAEVEDDSDLYKKLTTATKDAGDPRVPFRIESYQPRLFRVSAAIKIDPDFEAQKISPQVEKNLREAFSFESRAFGQPVHLSELVAEIQNTSGIVAVVVQEFYRSDQAPERRIRIPATIPKPGDEQPLAAELLTLDPRPLQLELMQ